MKNRRSGHSPAAFQESLPDSSHVFPSLASSFPVSGMKKGSAPVQILSVLISSQQQKQLFQLTILVMICAICALVVNVEGLSTPSPIPVI